LCFTCFHGRWCTFTTNKQLRQQKRLSVEKAISGIQLYFSCNVDNDSQVMTKYNYKEENNITIIKSNVLYTTIMPTESLADNLHVLLRSGINALHQYCC
jgi:hypothetical protein